MKEIRLSKAHLLAIERYECKRSFYEFVQSFWDVIIKEPPIFNWHIEYLCDELQLLSTTIVERRPKLYDIIINIPPGTTKSTIVTIMFPAWLWTNAPWARIISNSYSMDLSIEQASKSKDIIISEKYQLLFPEVRLRGDKSGKGAYENTATGARYTTSTGGTITGKHAHLILNDDPLNPSQAVSKVQRDSANDHTKTLSSRKVNKDNTPIVTIMQRLHESDVTGYLLGKKSDSIKHICLPAELSDNVLPKEVRCKYVNGLLDPIRLNSTVIEEARVDLGSKGYAGQFGQTPVAEGGNIVKIEWFQKVSRAEFWNIKTKDIVIHFFVDTAYTNKTENDPTGMIATCMIGHNLYILNAKKVYMKFPDLVRFLPEWCLQNGYAGSSTVRIEPKANGLSVIDQLRESSKLNIVNTPSPNESKLVKLTSVSPKIECSRVYLVEDIWNEDFIDEVAGFPNKDHDEYVDVLCYAIDFFLNGNTSSDLEKLVSIF